MYNSESINKQFSLSPDYQGHFAQKLDEGIPDEKSRFCLIGLTGKKRFSSLQRIWDGILFLNNRRSIYVFPQMEAGVFSLQPKKKNSV